MDYFPSAVHAWYASASNRIAHAARLFSCCFQLPRQKFAQGIGEWSEAKGDGGTPFCRGQVSVYPALSMSIVLMSRSAVGRWRGSSRS
jgi:hypothetical protein